ncbi:MAG: CoB--CoM heterodisulfide reductase iron-sulfur subunit A family protein [Armatimonadetes bacterium]|nr:CoB--CoM heterodisulfide reductase iron-sulfur subunit A family protein [Armatimonadota bacterium]
MTNVEKPKIALFLCGCSTNISNLIDLDAIAEWARKREDIDIIEVHSLLCSPDGKEFFKQEIARNKPENVIIAACSPHQHEVTFQDLAAEAGLNIGHIQMVNIREHCAWVTPDKVKATEKAKSLINAAMMRAELAEDIEKQTMIANTDVLIIGGGIAGIEASLIASKAGRKVFIVERDISLGGEIIKTEEIAPNMACAPCLLAPRLSEVRDDPNITVITNAVVTEVLGFLGNFTVKIHKKARYVDDSCIGCDACFEVCPVTVPSEFNLELSTRNAIYTLFPGAVPAMAVIDKDICKHFIDDSCNACIGACPFGSINFDEKDEEIVAEVGAIVIATGFETGDPSVIEEMGYRKIENVYTIREFERLTCSNGPTGSKIKLKNGEEPTSIAVIHCADSLRENGIPYCSGTCCIRAAKVGELARKQIPDVRVINIHNDLVFTGPAANDFYRKQLDGGTEFVKTDHTSIKIYERNDKIAIEGAGILLEVDMVVLSTGVKPAKGTEALAEMLNIDIGKNGFFQSDHELLHATCASVDCIYIAGSAAGPCDVAESVTRAQATVGDAISKLVPGREIELEMMTTVIDEDKCGGCKLCITVCPFKAIEYDAEENISKVIEAICRGCGTCAATCPSGAAKAKYFTDKQIFAEIGGLLNV